MNKDVIYIEPEDDITNIISKLESAKEKIVALVPPKKSGVLRSVVNIKLITKASSAKNKKVVFVTTDPSIIKLAATAKIPVTKNLQTPPTIPSLDDTENDTANEEVLEEEPVEVDDGTQAEGEEEAEEKAEPEEEKSDQEEVAEEKAGETEKDGEDEEKEKSDDKKDEEAAAKADKKAKKEKKEKKTHSNPVIAWILNYKKWVMAGGAAIILLILFLVWALAIAPAAKITVFVRTDANNFSELVSFTTDPGNENTDEGIFYLEPVQIEEERKVEFTATGTKNVGEKASGEIIIQAGFWDSDINRPLNINSGSAFKAGGLTFYSNSDVSLSWSGDDNECENKSPISLLRNGCLRSAKVSVTAAAPGEAYNIDKTSFTTPNDRVTAYSEAAFTGGTDKNVTIVSGENVSSVKDRITEEYKTEEKKEEVKKALDKQISDDKIKIDSTYKQTFSDPESSPKIDEEVTDNVIPTATIKVTTLIYVLDKTKLEEYISKKAKLANDQKIYAISSPFVENFSSSGDNSYTGKLKASYHTGPTITENDVLELVKGKGFGDIQHDLGSVNGVSKVSTEGSYPWVTTAPGDSNKITIEMVIEDNAKDDKDNKKNNP